MPNWEKTVNIKHLLTNIDDNGEARKIAHKISDILEEQLTPTRFNSWELQDIIDMFDDSTGLDDTNNALTALYDWADENRVWLGVK